MNKKTYFNLKVFLVVSLFLLAVSFIYAFTNNYADCYSYGDAKACSEIDMTSSFSGLEFTNGDFIGITCFQGDRLYIDTLYDQCDKNGCDGTQVSFPYYYELSPSHDRVVATCWDYDSNNGYWAWNSVSVWQNGLKYIPPEDTTPPDDGSSGSLNIFQIIWNWLVEFFKSLGFGSVGGSSSTHGGGTL